MENTVNGVKGFDENLKCCPTSDIAKQYELGGDYEESEAIACRKGFHFCENPMDVFGYYPPAKSRYAEVVGSGKLSRDSDDSKVACTKLHVGVEIGITGLISAGVKFMLDRIKWDDAKESNTGDRSAATNTGYQSAATNTGDRSAATNTGDRSAATVEGKESVAIATGYEGKARGALGCWIVLAEWEERGYEYHIKDVKSASVDGEKIKADTFYRLVNGAFVEAE